MGFYDLPKEERAQLVEDIQYEIHSNERYAKFAAISQQEVISYLQKHFK